MCKSIYKFLFALSVGVYSALASLAFAADSGNIDPGGGVTKGLSYKLQNPLQFSSIQEFIIAILKVIIVIATPIVVIFIILAGFKYVTARGNPSDIQEATRALTYAIIGGILIIGAVAIGEIIKDLVNAFA